MGAHDRKERRMKAPSFVLRYDDEVLVPSCDDALAVLEAVLTDHADAIMEDPDSFVAAVSAELLDGQRYEIVAARAVAMR
jgi:hypothetical protein